MALEAFHPAVATWFRERFGTPTESQRLAWPEIARGRHTLIAAPTGSGKTLAAFLAALDGLVREGLAVGALPDEVRVVYVSPLKALSNDVRRNLDEPLDGIRAALAAAGAPGIRPRSLVRTGDTPAAERAAMTRRPPHLLVTTPESLYVLLTSEGGRRTLRTVRTVIVDEIHAVLGDKRGSHLALSLERLADLARRAGHEPQRIGLSATQRPIAEVARFLVGARGVDATGRADCAVIDVGHRRPLELRVELPGSPLEAVMPGEVWAELHDRVAALVAERRTTLVFVNTRRQAERSARALAERLGEEAVAAHHGSLARQTRLDVELRLKEGRLRALVATASLELGIDVGHVDLVCNIGSTRAIATLLQRVGRSGHDVGGTSVGRLFPTTRDELAECAALLDAVRRGELESIEIPRAPLDVLAQQIVAEVACGERGTTELYELARTAWPYRDLQRECFDEVVAMLARGFATRRGRRGALIHHDLVAQRLRPRRGARLTAVTSGGAIPDRADYQVVVEPAGHVVGTVDEDFAIESMAGNIFQLGNASWRIRRIEQGRVYVSDAAGEPPNIPFWFGEAPARSPELSAAVSRLRTEIADRLDRSRDSALAWLADEVGLGPAAAEQLLDYLAAARAALGELPTLERVIAERFFDEAGDQHLVIHTPFGARVNRAWGLALRKRFCRAFNFELQAAATDDALILSLGPTHSFPLDEPFRYLATESARGVLVQALLDAPMFTVRWRWNAGRALAVPRRRGGKAVPPRLQRMQAEDLIAVVFPDQLACLENVAGDREIPDHPLVRQTIADCLGEAMDVERFEALLDGLRDGRIATLARELTEPSPLAHEILNARPYAFLDDAPLEERRTQAVYARRWLDPRQAAELGRLDAAAIDAVEAEARPEPRDADELLDALEIAGFLTADEGSAWQALFDELCRAHRATLARVAGAPGPLWVAAEGVPRLVAACPGTHCEVATAIGGEAPHESAAALAELIGARLERSGPRTPAELGAPLGLDAQAVRDALVALEAEGRVLRGRFRPGAPEEEWCERGILARIHRRTLDRLRREIRPVAPQTLVAFLAAWQRVEEGRRIEGPEALEALLEQLEGFEAPAAAWEGDLLPARAEEYDPQWLDALCLSGRFVWARLSPSAAADRVASRPLRTTPIALVRRSALAAWSLGRGAAEPAALSHEARVAFERLERGGASFFDEIVTATGLLRTQVEQALGELVAAGLATSDSFSGLRALLTPSDRRPALDGRRGRSRAAFGMENAGRWSLLARPGADADAAVETIARTLLRRYGVVFRALLPRESSLPPWRDLLRVYRRLEARGEIRGGRFVEGFSGEQYALAEAVAGLRAARREAASGRTVSISAADPLNVVGTIVPGPRVAALTGNRVLYRDGAPLAVLEAGCATFLVELGAAERWEAQNALVRRRVPPRLKAYLGRPA